ncbi:MAG: UDP-N-acetylmuramate--L-alanine ligase [Rickettsiales bacterium]|nr:UDP-N-acetylmuramate--L-alanine ligase [Rickettsiales bacterium]
MITLPLRRLPLGRTMPLQVGMLHFVGIGGIGMSGIAEILHNLGYQVQGSDLSENYNVERLRAKGMVVHIGQRGENVGDASVVIISSAVKDDNPEVLEARARRIPVVRRAEMLAELMRLKMSIAIAGTHGKTTTTSLTAALLDAAAFAPTVINGGIINAYGTNAVLGTGEWMVVEADESDGTFIKLPITIAVITNIDPEHLEHYGSFDGVRAAFRQFLDNLPFYGFGVLCIDHPEVQALVAKAQDRRIITYGLSPQADIRAVQIRTEAGGQRFHVECEDRNSGETTTIADVFLPMHGRHNVQNALAAITVARELKITPEQIIKGFAAFKGVKRRFTKTGEVGGITVIDDYGHHPVEIAATLASARQAVGETGGRVIAVVQPHRYSRLRDLFEEFCTCFNDADTVLVADVYNAGESPIEGIHRDALVEGLRRHGHKHVEALVSENALPEMVAAQAKSGDFIICLGAGSITYWAQALPEKLAAELGLPITPEARAG